MKFELATGHTGQKLVICKLYDLFNTLKNKHIQSQLLI
jgi:hypothetical protein